MEHEAQQSSLQRFHESAWPDMFVNLQTAYSELTRTQFELERQAAEIETARDLFLQVIESMSEGWFLMDRTGRIVRINPAASALIEYDAADLVGRPFAQICGRGSIPATPGQLVQRDASGRLPRDLSAGR